MTDTQTVDEVLTRCRVGNGFCYWYTDGGLIQLTESELRLALVEAYDVSMPDWPSLVEMVVADQSYNEVEV